MSEEPADYRSNPGRMRSERDALQAVADAIRGIDKLMKYLVKPAINEKKNEIRLEDAQELLEKASMLCNRALIGPSSESDDE